MKVLITGFGAFPGVPRNPSAELVRALEGRRLGEHTLHPLVIPVSWTRGPECTVAAARELGAGLVVGVGVAMERPTVTVERRARCRWSASPDADGLACDGLEGPADVPATLDVERLAEALGAGLSEDAGDYVCNTWLYRVSQALEVPVGFVHVPAHGLEPERLIDGVRALVDGL